MSTEQVIMALLSIVVVLIGYWASRLDTKAADLEKAQGELYKKLLEDFVRRDDCRLTHTGMSERLQGMDAKLDRLVEGKKP